MFRFVFPALVVVASALVVPVSAVAQSKTLKLGQIFKGELGGVKKQFKYRPPATNTAPLPIGRPGFCYAASVPIMLKAGQEVSITATVTGKTRIVGIECYDPQKKQVEKDEEGWTPTQFKTCTLHIDEVSATGKFMIVVFSDQAGPFTLKVTNESEENDREAIEAEIRNLRMRLAELEAKLKTLDEKSKKK
jgi:hypothetical protein